MSSALAAMLLLLPAYAVAYRSDAWARSQFAAAQRLHQSLEARPAQQFTRADYERVINAYRLVYFEAPASSKADPSVVAVAQLKEEMGRRFEDEKVLRSAIEQYEFLRKQYPGSKARFAALYHIGEIYQEDLHDKVRADAAFREFLERYPRNQFAEQARRALAEPVERASLKTAVRKPLPQPQEVQEANKSDDDQAPTDDGAKHDTAVTAESPKAILVTGIRHWSTPEYDRIVIDLDGSVKFESQRIDDPDRIFFDLLNTRLDAESVAKSYDIDDDFLKKVRVSQFRPGRTRIVLEVNEVSDFHASLKADPPRLVVDVRNTNKLTDAKKEAAPVAAARDDDHSTAAIALPASLDKTQDDACQSTNDDSNDCQPQEDANPAKTATVVTRDGIKKTIVYPDDVPGVQPASRVDVSPEVKAPMKAASTSVRMRAPKSTKPPAASDAVEAREAQPTASGDRSLTRVLGLKIGKIVIDPGHGGHDTGTIGPKGLEEKDVVLDVSRRLGKLLTSRLGAEVVYTRNDDTFIPLETRTAIANREGADLFISVHANSSRDADARGVETYYLNFTSSPDALEVAARENAVSDKSIHELQDLVKKIALKEKIEESQEFASDVEASLHSGLAAKSPGVRDRGVKKAPFIVLIGANMPSILAEISFVSNPTDERKLRSAEYRQRIAESLYRGIAKYANGLSGIKVASKIDKGEGQ